MNGPILNENQQVFELEWYITSTHARRHARMHVRRARMRPSTSVEESGKGIPWFLASQPSTDVTLELISKVPSADVF